MQIFEENVKIGIEEIWISTTVSTKNIFSISADTETHWSTLKYNLLLDNVFFYIYTSQLTRISTHYHSAHLLNLPPRTTSHLYHLFSSYDELILFLKSKLESPSIVDHILPNSYGIVLAYWDNLIEKGTIHDTIDCCCVRSHQERVHACL